MLSKERLGEIVGAKRQIVEGSMTLWNARLEALIAAGDMRGALAQMLRAAEEANNCGCNNGCDRVVGGELGRLTQPTGGGSIAGPS